MTSLIEGKLTFTFDDDCEVGKYDQWSFHQESFQSAAGGSKAIDFVCVGKGVSWLIEVTDYRNYPLPKPSCLSDEVARKVRDTLAGLATAATNADDVTEKKIAQLALSPERKWRVALHLEQSDHRSKLWRKMPDSSKLLIKLRKRLRFVDSGAYIVSTQCSFPDIKWRVKDEQEG